MKALVTGASSGIGAAYAAQLAARGHPLVLVARDEARLTALASGLANEHGVAVDVLPADLARPAGLEAVEARLSRDREITWLVNNAGISAGGRFTSLTVGQVDQMVALNVLAVTRLALAAARRFAETGGGTIINISSVTALLPERFEPVYLATKAYVLSLSQAMHGSLAGQGVRIQAVLPGVTRTRIWGESLENVPAEMIMEADTLVMAALAGLEAGERVTIPSLGDLTYWDNYERARTQLAPYLSLRLPADRYRVRSGDGPGEGC